jgi:hypothetical protein
LVENSYWHFFQTKSGESRCVKGGLCKFVFEESLYWPVFPEKIHENIRVAGEVCAHYDIYIGNSALGKSRESQGLLRKAFEES